MPVGIQGPTNPVQQAGSAMRRYAEDRRNDQRYEVEAKKNDIGLQSLDRRNEQEDLDHQYGMFKNRMQRGMQTFAMNPTNYQEAIDTMNEYYGTGVRVTHRPSDPNNPNSDPVYDVEGVDPKTGEPFKQNGLTKQDMGARLSMSMAPDKWFQHQVDKKEAAESASATHQADMEMQKLKETWSTLRERIKAAAKAGKDAADNRLKYLKEASRQANNAWGSLGEDDTFTFGDSYDAEYASMNAAYAAALAQFGDGRYVNDTTTSHNKALSSIKAIKEEYEAQIRSESPDMMDEEVDRLVMNKVDDEVVNRVESLFSKAGESMEAPTETEIDPNAKELIKNNWEDLKKKMKEAGASDNDIESARKKYIGDEEPVMDEAGDAGITEPEPAGQSARTSRKDIAGLVDNQPSPDAIGPESGTEDTSVKMESVEETKGLGLIEKPVEFGSKSTSGRGQAAKRGSSSVGLDKDRKKLSEDLSAAEKQQGDSVVMDKNSKLGKLRSEAARRVINAYKGGGVIKRRNILKAALASGELPPEIKKEVQKTLGAAS